MKKSKSFSKYGRYLQSRASLTSNPQLLQKAAERAVKSPLKVDKKQPKWIQGFNRITGRQKLNSFQVFNVKDAFMQNNYQVKDQLVRTRSQFYPMKIQKGQRLGQLLCNRQYQKGHTCKKCSNLAQKNENVLTARDLQNFRKSHHSSDFKKQIPRLNTYIKKPVGTSSNLQQTNFMSKKASSTSKLQGPRLIKAHSFDSYTKRDFLSDKKLLTQGAPFYSGADSFKVPMEKYKGGWKMATTQQFSKSPSKISTRYDSANDPFYTKLGYNPKQLLVKKKIPVIDISQQTPRQPNQVHSKYPIRLNI